MWHIRSEERNLWDHQRRHQPPPSSLCSTRETCANATKYAYRKYFSYYVLYKNRQLINAFWAFSFSSCELQASTINEKPHTIITTRQRWRYALQTSSLECPSLITTYSGEQNASQNMMRKATTAASASWTSHHHRTIIIATSSNHIWRWG